MGEKTFVEMLNKDHLLNYFFKCVKGAEYSGLEKVFDSSTKFCKFLLAFLKRCKILLDA